VSELNEDEQAWANGYLQKVDYGGGRFLTLVPTPVQFNETSAELRPAPEHAAHTEEVMCELGMGWDRILELKELGVIV
jgi:crotonobetainyl-CoA:carnitine CoA-transferase CaiB-like acyl-CoA transferase